MRLLFDYLSVLGVGVAVMTALAVFHGVRRSGERRWRPLWCAAPGVIAWLVFLAIEALVWIQLGDDPNPIRVDLLFTLPMLYLACCLSLVAFLWAWFADALGPQRQDDTAPHGGSAP